MISKELLKEVTGHTTLEYDGYNIHEIAHKCKEWACLNNDMLVYTAPKYSHKFTSVEVEGYKCRADTEPEAIFKACEWILNVRK